MSDAAVSPEEFNMQQIPTADEVNPHAFKPVDRIRPYDYKKHVRDYLGLKLKERRSEIGKEVAARLNDTFGIAMNPNICSESEVSCRSEEVHSGNGGFVNARRSLSLNKDFTPSRVPKPPSQSDFSPRRDQPQAGARPRSAIYAPIATSTSRSPSCLHQKPASTSRPQSSPVYRAASLAFGGISPRSSSKPYALEDALLAVLSNNQKDNLERRTAGVASGRSSALSSSSANSAELLSNADHYGVHDLALRRGSCTDDTTTGSRSNIMKVRPFSAISSLRPEHDRSAVSVSVPVLKTRPTPEEVAVAVRLLKERAGASPVRGVPFVPAGSAAGGDRKGAPRTELKRDDNVGPISGGSLGVGGGSWAGAVAQGPLFVPQQNNLIILKQKKAQEKEESKAAECSRALNTQVLLRSSFINPKDALNDSESQQEKGKCNPANNTRIESKSRGPDMPQRGASVGRVSEGRTSTSPKHRQDTSHGDEPLYTPKAPLFRAQCNRANRTYQKNSEARARRRQMERQREAEERQELERVAAATVRMQADHEHRRAIRQRRYLQGLALKQPFEVARFSRVVAQEWASVEEERTEAVLDDIPLQVLLKSKYSEGGGARDREQQQSLVQQAVASARHTRFEREERTPQSQFTPRRELL